MLRTLLVLAILGSSACTIVFEGDFDHHHPLFPDAGGSTDAPLDAVTPWPSPIDARFDAVDPWPWPFDAADVDGCTAPPLDGGLPLDAVVVDGADLDAAYP